MDTELARYLTRVAFAASSGQAVEADVFSQFAEARLLHTNGSSNEWTQLADLRNSLIAGIEPHYDGAVQGLNQESREYERRMRALANIAAAWTALRSPIA